MRFNPIALATATFALVVAADDACVSETKYTLSIFLDTNATSLHAIDSGSGDIVLVADPSINAPGTTLSETGTAPNTELNLEVDHATECFSVHSGIYHLSVPDMGERYGAAAPVMGSLEYAWPHWYTTEQNIWPKQTSGAQTFFTCKINLQGNEYTALSWGLMSSNGSMPEGCTSTWVAKTYDVQVPC